MKSYTFAKISARGHLTEDLRLLLRCNRDESRSIVCSAFGLNRSRTVIEAFHYAKMGHHLENEYEGFLEGFLSRQGFSFFSLTFENHLNLIVREWVLQPISDLL